MRIESSSIPPSHAVVPGAGLQPVRQGSSGPSFNGCDNTPGVAWRTSDIAPATASGIGRRQPGTLPPRGPLVQLTRHVDAS